MKIRPVWFDGRCKKCGSNVYEKSSDRMGDDYMNACSNENCEENYWHYCGDDEQLDYYNHEE